MNPPSPPLPSHPPVRAGGAGGVLLLLEEDQRWPQLSQHSQTEEDGTHQTEQDSSQAQTRHSGEGV